MDWAISVTAELGNASNEVRERPEEIDKKLEEVMSRLKSLEKKLDRQVLAGVHAGVTHLVDGMNSKVSAVRTAEFVMARQEFVRLTSLEPESSTGAISNKYLICLGYWGNYYYFLLRQDERNSAIQVYECTAAYPSIALVLFPSGFFSKSYLELITQKGEQLERARARLKKAENSNLLRTTKYYAKQTGRVLTSGVVAAAGVIGGVITSGLGFPPWGLAVAGGGFKAANEVYKALGTDKPYLLNAKKPRNEVGRLTKEICDLWQELRMESEVRKEELQQVTFKRLLGSRSRIRQHRRAGVTHNPSAAPDPNRAPRGRRR